MFSWSSTPDTITDFCHPTLMEDVGAAEDERNPGLWCGQRAPGKELRNPMGSVFVFVLFDEFSELCV